MSSCCYHAADAALCLSPHSTIVGTLAGTAEVSTSNLRSGASFDNLKASWGKKLSLGDFSSQLDCSYDYNDNKEFIKDAKLSGSLIDGSGDDLSLGYEVTKNFGGDKTTEVTLTAEVSGTTVTADLDTADNLKEVGASRSVTIGDRDVTVSPSFLVKAQTARVKLMTALGKDNLSVQADIDGTDLSAIEVEYERDLEDGRTLTASLTPADKNLEVEVTDTKFESGATWTAKASVPLEGDNMVDAAKLTLTRAWSW
mgnify:FL=1